MWEQIFTCVSSFFGKISSFGRTKMVSPSMVLVIGIIGIMSVTRSSSSPDELRSLTMISTLPLQLLLSIFGVGVSSEDTDVLKKFWRIRMIFKTGSLYYDIVRISMQENSSILIDW